MADHPLDFSGVYVIYPGGSAAALSEYYRLAAAVTGAALDVMITELEGKVEAVTETTGDVTGTVLESFSAECFLTNAAIMASSFSLTLRFFVIVFLAVRFSFPGFLLLVDSVWSLDESLCTGDGQVDEELPKKTNITLE